MAKEKNLNNTQIESLPMLSYVGGSLDLYGSQIESLPMLSYVKGWLDLRRCSIKTLPMLSYVGGDLIIKIICYLRNQQDQNQNCYGLE